MYTKDWALNFNGFSKNEEIDLKMFSNFFEEYIANRKYIYLDDKGEARIKIVVEGTQLPHVLGLHKWNNLPSKNASLQYEAMKNGDIDLDLLKIDDGTWQEYRKRIEFIPYSYKMLTVVGNSDIRIVPSEKSNTFRKRGIDIIFKIPTSKFIYVLEMRRIDDHYVFTSSSVYNRNSSAFKAKYNIVPISQISIIEK
ncbi:MAG: hypothetical protein H9W82_06965 [Lactobacillus sp.]|nr:hypothetical protein [Lactobacillus sp.]